MKPSACFSFVFFALVSTACSDGSPREGTDASTDDAPALDSGAAIAADGGQTQSDGSTTSEVSIVVTPASVTAGGEVTVNVENGPGDPGNFVELYQVLGTCGDYTCWNWLGLEYLNGTQSEPAIGLTNASVPWTMPATAGTYAFYFRFDATTKHVQSNNVIVTGSAPPAGAADQFPRLGLISIGGPQVYASTFQAWAAKVHAIIIGGDWEGWENGRGYTKQSFIAAVKAQTKVNTRVFAYVNLNEMSFARTGTPFPTWYDEVNTMNWWLYDVGSSGTKTPDWQNPTANGLVDMDDGAPKDPTTSLGPYPWGAKYVNDYFHLGKYSGYSATPSLDGFFLDNVFVDPYVNGDWERDGTTLLQTSATAQADVMKGEASYFDYLRSVWPTGIQLGNSGDGIGQAAANGWSVAPLQNEMQGSVLEHALGKSYSTDIWGGSAVTMSYYQAAMATLTGARILFFGHGELSPTGSDPTAYSTSGAVTATSPAWQGMRYGLAECLMNDGYYTPDVGTYDEETVANRLWFDEFDGGGVGVGYLGNPSAGSAGAAQTAAWSNGVWKREFEKGIVLWSPKGNGAKTVSLVGLGNLKHLTGTQNPSLNDGASVTSVTLQDRDGLILLRN